MNLFSQEGPQKPSIVCMNGEQISLYSYRKWSQSTGLIRTSLIRDRNPFIRSRETIDKYTEDIAVDGRLIQKELGFVPQYNLKAGWEETIREKQGLSAED